MNPNEPNLTRRDFLKASAAVAGTGALLAPSGWADTQASPGVKKRYAIVGTGIRHRFYREAMGGTHLPYCDLVALCDVNLGRLKLSQKEYQEQTGIEVPTYLAKDFDQMVAETKPDRIIVTTVDGFHHQYIVRGMELGKDVISEKPMTTNAEKCRQIIDTKHKTGRDCTVTFNLRYSPSNTQVKDLLMSGVIGDILSVDFHWMLDTYHGASYFRRWHSTKELSGGLMVHKATHHFDLMNWWLSAIPVSVYALGKREYYTPKMAKRMGLASHHKRCLDCPEKESCGFFWDLARPGSTEKALYLDNEKYCGYIRDKCVFRPEIDIEDTMNVIVQYDNNATMSYSLNAFNSWEGYYVVFNGTKGRIEHKTVQSMKNNPDGSIPDAIQGSRQFTRVIPLRQPPYKVDLWHGEGGHGGGDPKLLNNLFHPEKQPDPYVTAADQRSGAYSILIGVAANESMKTGMPVRIADLVPNIAYPDYTPMPTRKDPVPMPIRPTDEG